MEFGAMNVLLFGVINVLTFYIFQVEDGTAKVGKDFTHSSASLIQFDPGVVDFILHAVH